MTREYILFTASLGTLQYYTSRKTCNNNECHTLELSKLEQKNPIIITVRIFFGKGKKSRFKKQNKLFFKNVNKQLIVNNPDSSLSL